MLEIFKTPEQGSGVLRIDEIEKGCWINLAEPDEEELDLVIKHIGVEQTFLRDSLDVEEKPRIDIDEDQILIIVDIPFVFEDEKSIKFETLPMGILMIRDDYIITICSKQASVLERFRGGQIKNLFTYKKTRFVLQTLYYIAKDYLKFLKHIDKKSEFLENALHKSMRNKDLYKLLELGKSLVYFTTSLKSNEAVLERLLKGKVIKMYEEDQDLLEDTIIENRQAIEMSTIYSSILQSTNETFASVISNNQNNVMKFLAAVTIVLAVPNVIFSFFGQNVKFPYGDNPIMWLLVLVGALSISGTIAYFLYKKDMF